MKSVQYPSFGVWLKKTRGSMSLQAVGRLIGKEHNTVSNYEKGYVRPPKLIVAYLINYFNGDPLEVAEFLRYDPIEIQDLCNSSIIISGKSTADFKDECWQKLGCARKFREIESPDSALHMINACILALETRIKAELDPQKDIKDLKYLLLLTYGEKVKCSTLLLPRHCVISEMLLIYSRMVKLSIDVEERYRKQVRSFSFADSFTILDSHSPTFSGLALSDSCLAAVYFVAQDYEKAISYQNGVILLCEFDKNLIAETYRGLILSLAHTHRIEEVTGLEERIEHLIGKEIDNPVDIDSLRCAIAEARMLVGKDGSQEIMAEVENSIYNTNKFLPLKRIQFYKTQLFLSINDLRMDHRVEFDRIQEVVTKGFSLAQLYKYRRHAKEITSLGKVIEGRGRVNLSIEELTTDCCSV
jgi:transcriptional regulator with XRE-family HTH domain